MDNDKIVTVGSQLDDVLANRAEINSIGSPEFYNNGLRDWKTMIIVCVLAGWCFGRKH
jgi:hypothetical protein